MTKTKFAVHYAVQSRFTEFHCEKTVGMVRYQVVHELELIGLKMCWKLLRAAWEEGGGGVFVQEFAEEIR